MQKFTILALLFLSVGLFAQKTSFEIGPEMDLPAGLKFWGQLYSGPDAHYVMLIKGGPAAESPSGATPPCKSWTAPFTFFTPSPFLNSWMGSVLVICFMPEENFYCTARR